MQIVADTPPNLEELVSAVNYDFGNNGYKPSLFALKFIQFIKLVNGEKGEENESPEIHLDMLDQIASNDENLFVSFRGSSKTSVIHEYMFLFIATYGGIDNFGEVSVAMYVSDTVDNGIKSMRQNLEFRYNNSEFLQQHIPYVRFTDVRWEFRNNAGKSLCVRGFGASALPLNTLLYTEDGSNTTIGSVAIGDKIYGANGKLCTVQIKSEIFDRPVYRIRLADGRFLDVCEEHINNIIFCKLRKKEYVWKERNITTKQLLKRKLYNINQKKDKQIPAAYIKNIKPINYPTKDLPVDPYTLGLLLSADSVQEKGTNIIHADKENMSTYLDNIPYAIQMEYKNKRHSNMVSVSLLNISGQIQSLGLSTISPLNMFIPECYFTADIAQRISLLAGLLDALGYITETGKIEFKHISKQLTLGITKLVRTLGGSATIKSLYIKKGNSYIRNNRYKVDIWLAQNNIVKLPRKIEKLKKYGSGTSWTKHCNMVAIESVVKIPQVPTQCIGVDSPDNLFIAGRGMVVTHNTGVRGFKEYGTRPTWLGLDDLMSDKNAESPTIIADIKKVLYRAARQAMHSDKRKINWTGTPFNARDPLYQAVSSGSWNTRVYPICEKFPCTKREFRGAWTDRFSYEFVQNEYNILMGNGEVNAFNQELMLRIMSDEDRLILDDDIQWYKLASIVEHKHKFNFYVTTDFATSASDSADDSVIAVWAYNNVGSWFYVDGIVKRQLMDANIDDLFRLCQKYKPQQVGIEVSGQQGGFIPWIQDQMLVRNIHFPLASEDNKGKPGIRPNTNKMARFQIMVPMFKMKKIFFPTEYRKSIEIAAYILQLSLAAPGGFKSRRDDCIDVISMLGSLRPWKPSEAITMQKDISDNIWEVDEDEIDNMDKESYLV